MDCYASMIQLEMQYDDVAPDNFSYSRSITSDGAAVVEPEATAKSDLFTTLTAKNLILEEM